jgi:hypothetical protein
MMNKEYYKEHRRNSFAQWAYSIQRIDLLIVSISGGGVYVCLETLKYCLEHHFHNTIILKVCGGIFVLALIVNFISQCTGEKANENEIKWSDEKLDENEVEAKGKQTIAESYSKATGILNISSMVSMFIGLILLLVYFFITF